MVDNVMKHKDFYGSVAYSADDNCFFGKVIGLSDLVTFEGDDVHTLKNAFEEAVDDYIVLCAEMGKEPQWTCEGSFGVRISPHRVWGRLI